MKNMRKTVFMLMSFSMLSTVNFSFSAMAEEKMISIIPEEENMENTDSVFASLPRNFVFTSGAGAWATEITIADDGTFVGQFHDSEMGYVGEGYPNGTVYICSFNGKFSQPQVVDDYTYSMKLEYIELETTPGEVYYENDMQYICSDAYGFDNADEFYIYLPGKPVADIPEGFLSWVYLASEWETVMPQGEYGIYNVGGEQGFTGYLEAGISDELAAMEEEDAILQGLLQSAATQMDIDAYTDQLYTLWDDKLNEIWQELKNTMDAETMDQLTQEEIQWITDKENAAALAVEGIEGSLQHAVYMQTAYTWTKERVYVLAAYLPTEGY